MMNLDARLARLEATHRRILRCLWCRYSLSPVVPSQSSQETKWDDYLQVKCWTCGTPYVVPLAGRTKRQREIFKLIHTSHPTKHYNDERIHTAQIWLSLSRSEVRRYRAFKQARRDDALGRQQGKSPAQRSHNEMTADQRKAERERELLRSQAREFDRQRNAQWKQKAKGPASFPVDKTLKEIEARYKLENWGEPMKEYVRLAGLEDDDYSYSRAINDFKVAAVTCHQHLSALKKREACELVLWGKVEPNTLEEIAFFEKRLKYLPDIARRRLKKEEEAKRREKEERERAHQEHLARIRQQSEPQQPSAQEKPFELWKPERRPSEIEIPYRDNGTVAASQRRSQQQPWRFDGQHISEGDERRRGGAIPKLPPDDGTITYQRKKAYYERYGVWLPDEQLHLLNRL